MQPRVTCHQCHYDLRGSESLRCPECGAVYDPTAAVRLRRKRRIISALIMAIVLYAPFAWLLFVDDDPSYVRTWMKLWPILPGFVPTHLLAALTIHRPFPEPASFMIMAVIALTALIAFTWLSSGGRTRLIVWTSIALALSVLNSFVALQLFRA